MSAGVEELEWRDRIGAAEVRAERLAGQADWLARRMAADMCTRDVVADAQAGLARDVVFILRALRALHSNAQEAADGGRAGGHHG